jgi:hypothetical protein
MKKLFLVIMAALVAINIGVSVGTADTPNYKDTAISGWRDSPWVDPNYDVHTSTVVQFPDYKIYEKVGVLSQFNFVERRWANQYVINKTWLYDNAGCYGGSACDCNDDNGCSLSPPWDYRDDIKHPAYYGLYCMRGTGTTAIWKYLHNVGNPNADWYITRYTNWKCV